MYDTIEDVDVGETHAFGSYEVTADEIREFARKYDPMPFHVDEDAAADSPFDGLVASGWHTAAMTQRLLVDNVLTDSGVIGSPGVADLRWRRPVRPGDSLSAEFEVDETEPWDENRGVIRATMRTLNGDDEVVMTMEVLILFPRA